MVLSSTKMTFNYILDENGKPKPEPDILTWGRWFERDERRIVRQQRWTRSDGVEVFVSTVFLGMDHRPTFGPPVLWETMTFIDGESVATYRFTSREAAIVGHNRAVQAEGGEVLESLGCDKDG
jgi:hypothetical protein